MKKKIKLLKPCRINYENRKVGEEIFISEIIADDLIEKKKAELILPKGAKPAAVKKPVDKK